MKITGHYDERTWFGEVKVEGVTLDPKESQRLVNHSPDGFSWGYAGSGPAQLALAILLHAGLHKREALARYQAFKFTFVATWPRDSFDVDIDFDGWLAGQRQPGELYP